MMAKLFKSVIVLAVILMFFGGTASAHGRGGDGKHYKKWHRSHRYHYHKARPHHRYHHKRHIHSVRRHDHHRRHGHAVSRRSEYRQQRYKTAKPHPLAPRLIYIGGLPVPVPPPPHEVLDYLTGH